MSSTARSTVRSLSLLFAAVLALALVAAPASAQELEDLPLEELPAPGEEEPGDGEEPDDGGFGDDDGFGDEGDEGDDGFGDEGDDDFGGDDGFGDESDDGFGDAQVSETPEGGVAAGGTGSALPPVLLATGLLLALVGGYALLAVRRPALVPARR